MTTTFPGNAAPGDTGRPSWLEARRQGKLTQAEIEEQRADARQRRQFAADEHARKVRNAERADKQAARAQARKARAAQLSKLGDWCKARYTHLIMIPVIGVPGALAADGQAAWGIQQYGPAGVILPAFSEGSMWVFAAKTSQARRANPDAPVWHLRLGTVVFAGVGAAMNFAHGMAQGGVWQGVTMAITSVSGVTAHQITTAGPRRTRQQRRDARLARKQARLENRVMRAAIEDGTVVIAADGSSRVSVRPGAVTLRRTWRGTRLEPARDIQGEIDDVTEAAITIVDHARAERDAAQADIDQARAQAAAVTAEAAQAVSAAQEEKDAALAELDRVRELARELRDAGETADARAVAAEQQLQQTANAGQAALQAAQREAETRLAELHAELANTRAISRNTTAQAEAARRELAEARDKIDGLLTANRHANDRADSLARELERAREAKPRPNETKKEALLRLYRAHEHHGVRIRASRTATELAAQIQLSPGAARNYVNEYLDELEAAQGEEGVA